MLTTLAPVLVTYAVGTASPGPANLTVMTIAARDGRRPALIFAGGVLLGGLTWAVLAATGLSAVLTSFAGALTALKVIGGGYLIYLAVRSARSALRGRGRGTAGATGVADPAPAPVSSAGWLRRGFLLHLTNPKALLVWAATMTVGLHAGSEPWMPLLIIACCELCGIVIFGAYAFVFSAETIARAYRRAQRVIEGAVAVVFAAFGVRLLLTPLEA
ncbi:LysE family translocator [Schumannella soli]|uniref:LysE family translocator n=1 Tax=Schumannella soli TaxID=2590779 RepID=A0A506Y9H8_9MICO|nr:LysE family translocator [Schumannella soli]